MQKEPDSAFVLAQSMIDFSIAQNYQYGEAKGYNIQAVSMAIQSNYYKALYYNQKSLSIKEAIGDLKGVSGSLNNIGIIYGIKGDNPKKLHYLERSLKINEQLGFEKGIATNLNNIGEIYQNQENNAKAFEYYSRSLQINKKLGYPKRVAAALNNIGVIHVREKNNEKALQSYFESLKIREELDDQHGVSSTLHNIANVYQEQGDYTKALEYIARSLTIRNEIGDQKGVVGLLTNNGMIYFNQKKYRKAISFCEKGLSLAKDIEVLEPQREACYCLYSTYKALGDSNNALSFLEDINAIEDSIQIIETSKSLQLMEFNRQVVSDSLKVEEEKLETLRAHEAEVKKKNRLNAIFIGVGLLSLLLAGGFFSRWRTTKKSKKIVEDELDRSDDLILNMMPAEIAEELKEKGEAQAKEFDTVSILFTDFKDFTKLSEKLSPTELVEELNYCFKAFDNICDKYNIEKIKTIGDSFMAAGGLTDLSDDAVKNTVLAALEMQSFISKRKSEHLSLGKPFFEMRAGINTGPAVAGIVGVKKFQYDIWGDTVNTASRMESHAGVGKVNISQHTYEYIKDDPYFLCENRGQITAKGKGNIEMYFVEIK